MAKNVLVTGAAGFIGSHTIQSLLSRGDRVVGLDNFSRDSELNYESQNHSTMMGAMSAEPRFILIKGDVRDHGLVGELFSTQKFDAVVHLAAIPGVRLSQKYPALYHDINLNGTLTLLEGAVGRLGCRQGDLPLFVFASSSSVYGDTKQIPFVETDPCNEPLTPYAASKRAAELLGYTYHHLYGLNYTALRFFTVYGPQCRTDLMAYKILDSIFQEMEVPLYNQGLMYRDWTYIDDIVKCIIAAVDHTLGYEIINLGSGQSVCLADFISLIERLAGRKARLVPASTPRTEVLCTHANIKKAQQLLGYSPVVPLVDGVTRFMEWYLYFPRLSNSQAARSSRRVARS